MSSSSQSPQGRPASPRNEFWRIVEPWSDDVWRDFMGAIELRPHSVRLVMERGSIARPDELARELEALTTRDRSAAFNYLLVAVAAYLDFRNGLDTAIPEYLTLKQGSRYSSPSQGAGGSRAGADVAVITIREDEFSAILKRLPGYQQITHPMGIYQHVEVAAGNEESVRVAVGRTQWQGSLAAQALATSMILDLKPKWILVVGIAGSIPATDYSLGDVLLSQRLHDLTVSAKAAGKSPTFQDMGGAMHGDVMDLLTQLPANQTRLGEWNQLQQMSLKVPEIEIPESPDDPRLCGPADSRQSAIRCLQSKFQSLSRDTTPLFHIGPVIDASTLVMDPEVVDIWQKTTSHACAIEMELAGVYSAARHFGKGEARVLSIRGFSDVVGFRRGPEWTEYACHSAASFANALIRSGLLKDAEHHAP